MRALLIPTTVLLALSGCQQPAETRVTGAWVRLSPVPGRPAGGYFRLAGGAVARTLTGVRSPAAGRIELHETMQMSGQMAGAMAMRPLAQVALPAGGSIAFAPGGQHLMLFDVAPAVKPGGKIRLSFAFADGGTVTADARVIAAGEAPPTKAPAP